jgi:hypothetical protein
MSTSTGPESDRDVAAQLREFARNFGPQIDRLEPARVVENAAAAVPRAVAAGLTLVRGTQRPRTLAATDLLVEQVDAIQYDMGEGPCLEAIEDDDIIRADELAADPRWPKFSSRVVTETPVRSMFAARLFLGNGDQGALNFYAKSARGFTELDLGIGAVFSCLAGLALRNAIEQQRSVNLEAALDSSRQIGMAMGIVMSSKLVTAERAFDLLRDASQRQQRKLRDVAAQVVESGRLPEPPHPEAG